MARFIKVTSQRYLLRIRFILFDWDSSLFIFFYRSFSLGYSTIPITYYSVEIGTPKGMTFYWEIKNYF